MTKIVTVLLLVVAIGAQAQYIEQVREAELHFVRNEVSEASAIYNQLFDTNRKALLSQDCLNAAYCEMEVSGFLGAQRFLNLLAVRNVPFGVLEEYSGLKDQVDEMTWNNFQRVYGQLFTSSIPQGIYDVFQTEFIESFNNCYQILREDRPRLPTYSPTTKGVAIYLGDEIVRELSTADSISKVKEIGQAIADSVILTEAFQKSRSKYLKACKDLHQKFITFFEANEWPVESQLSKTYPFSRGGQFLQYVGFWMGLQDPGKFVFMNSGNLVKNYIYTDNERQAVIDVLLKAIEEEKLKPTHVFTNLYPSEYQKMQGKKLLAFNIESENCELQSEHYLQGFLDEMDYDLFQSTFGLESQERVLEKYIWSHLSEKKMSLNVYFQKEESTFSSCEEAMDYIQNNGLTKVSALTELPR